MAKFSQFSNWLKSLFFHFSMPLTYKKPNIYSQIFQMSGHLLLWDSKDLLLSSVSSNLKSAHWKTTLVTQITEADPNFPTIRWPLHLGRSSFGNVKPTLVPQEGSQAHQKLVTKTHCEIEEQHTLERVLQLQLQFHWVQLQLQCHWVQCEGYIQNNFAWKTILAIPPNLLSFCLGATYVLLSLINLKQCHLASESR